MPAILVIEDHPNLQSSILRILSEAGYDATAASTLAAARTSLSPMINLVILDLMLPDGSGLDWLAEIRSSGNRVPVLILTAKDSIRDRISGLDQGADDYLVKPFSLDELLARIRALLRRDANPSSATMTVADLCVDLIHRTAVRGKTTLSLQNRQLELLIYLLRHVNQIVTRDMIARDVWKEPTVTWTNVIEVHINQLRKQLNRAGDAPLLHTVRGQGYVLGDAP